MSLIRWTRVKAGEAATFGVKSPEAGRVGRTASGLLYFVWIQARPRDEGPYYAGAYVTPDGHIERYYQRGYSQGVPPPPGVNGAWLCDEGDLTDAKNACETDAARRAREEPAP